MLRPTIALAVTLLATSGALASPLITRVNQSYAKAPLTIDFGSGAALYTLSNTGDFFNPLSIMTAGTAKTAAFGGFLGIPLAPTSFFTDRGRTPFIDAGQNYQPFPTGGTVAYSVSPAYLAFAFTLADGIHYGYALTSDTTLIRYAYESAVGVGIQAPPVPEPAAFALLGLGAAVLIAARRSARLG